MRKNERMEIILQNKANQVAESAALIWEKTRDWQMIREFMTNRFSEIELTEDQEHQLKIYQYVYDQLSTGKYSRTEIVASLNKLYNRSLRQAYDDIRISQELFSIADNFNKKFEINNELQICRQLRKQCVDLMDYKNAAIFSKRINELIAMQPEEDDSPADMFETHKIVGVFNPRLLGGPDIDMTEMQKMLQEINDKNNVKINTKMFENIPFTEIPDENDSKAL